MKRSLFFGLLALCFLLQSPVAHADMKLMLCLSGVKFSCRTAINQKKFKSSKDKERWIERCVRLGISQCKQRLGPGKKSSPPSRRGHVIRPTSSGRPSSTHRASTPQKSCRSICRGETRIKIRRKYFKSGRAARMWNFACIKRCKASRGVSRSAPVHHRRVHNSPHRRSVPAPKRNCRGYCRGRARRMQRTNSFKPGETARSWYKACFQRCNSK